MGFMKFTTAKLQKYGYEHCLLHHFMPFKVYMHFSFNNSFFFFFLYLEGHTPQYIEVPRLDVKSELQPQRHQIQAMSATYTTALTAVPDP